MDGILSAIGRKMNHGLRLTNLKFLRRTDAELLSQSQFRYASLLRRFHIDEVSLFSPTLDASSLPVNERDYLRPDNPYLKDLIKRYGHARHPVLTHSVWTSEYTDREVDLQSFRGDVAYVWQMRDLNSEVNYLVTFQYLNALDDLGLMDQTAEDGLFGAHTVNIGGTIVSRDLLDSINEIYFLERALGISNRADFNVLDIGAGYGRLAYRLTDVFPGMGRVYCVDAVPVSTFLCEYYLRFRHADERALTIPLDQLEELLAHHRFDLAINIHSFSECPLASIGAWLDIIAANDVRYLFIVPNGGINEGSQLLSRELETTDGPKYRDFFPLIADRGYELLIREPKFRDALVQRHGLSPTYYYLFERVPR
jgi:SAM-dependent methyltransferase